jgi:hypothetical protein
MRYLWIALSTVAAVAAAAGAFLYVQSRPGEAQAPAPPLPPLVAEETHYYVLVALIEVEPRNGDQDWDMGSPPDLYYRIRWQGQEVFRSATKKDTLVAKWSNVAVDLGDVVRAVSLDDSIKAARIAARKGSVLEIEVFDADLARDDPVGSWTVPVEELRVGDQAWTRPGGRIVTAQCRVIAIDGVGFESLTR